MKLRNWLIVVFWGVFAFLKADERLTRPPGTWDEAIYYNVATNVLGGRWLLPLHDASNHPLGIVDPFLHKPPLTYWLFAGSMKLLGESPSSPRLLTAIVTASITGVVVLLAVRLGGPLTGSVAGLIFTHMPAPFATHAGNNIATDPYLTLFTFAAIFLFVRSMDADLPQENYYAVGAGVMGGLAILSKGVASGPLAIGCIPLAFVARKSLSRQSWGMLFGAAIVVIAPWFLSVGILAPNELWHQMIVRQTVGRATGRLFISSPGMFPFMDYPYFRNAPQYFGRWWWLLSLAILSGVWNIYARTHRQHLYLITWPLLISVIGIYAFAGNHPWYLLPAAPAVAILIASAIAEAFYILADALTTWAVLRLNPH